jgi:ParB family transcriptional regulator, chromosome partitioning protein
MAKKGLGGKGLSALIPDFEMGVPEINSNESMRELLLDEIVPNKNQPRKLFDDVKLQELVDSIIEKGVLQPIVVQKSDEGYEIIVGERRWRASKKAGLKKIPAVIKETTDTESLELAIIENIHRHDLNPIEEGMAYSRLAVDFGMKQEQIAKKVGKNRASVANYIRLLKLSRPVQEDILAGKLSMGHARALLGLEREKEIEVLRQKILKDGLNVRQTESLVKQTENKNKSKTPKSSEGPSKSKNVFLKTMEDSLQRQLGTKVELIPSKKGGKLIISYYSNEDLERLQECFFSKT